MSHRAARLGWLWALPIALMTLIPVMTVIASALSPQPEVWQHLWHYVLPRVTLNTLILMALVAVCVACVGVPLAWLTAVCDFPGQRFFAWALMLPLAFPAYVLAFVQMGLFEYAGPVQSALRAWFGNSRWFPEIRGSLWGTVLVLTMAFYPYVYLLTRNAFLTQGRRAVEAARTLGLSAPRAFWQVSILLAGLDSDGEAVDCRRIGAGDDGNPGRFRRGRGLQLRYLHHRLVQGVV